MKYNFCMNSVAQYREIQLPEGLSFDEASLFWRLRLGEGLPTRKWHQPLDRTKTWEEIKTSLDQKISILCAAHLGRQASTSGFWKKFVQNIVQVFKKPLFLSLKQ